MASVSPPPPPTPLSPPLPLSLSPPPLPPPSLFLQDASRFRASQMLLFFTIHPNREPLDQNLQNQVDRIISIKFRDMKAFIGRVTMITMILLRFKSNRHQLGG